MICASEQAVIIDKEISNNFEKIMKEYGCYFLTEKETEKMTEFAESSICLYYERGLGFIICNVLDISAARIHYINWTNIRRLVTKC
jgi:hypothetical protein